MTPESLLKELDEQYIIQKLELLFQRSYEEGVIAGQKRFNYPPVLKREHLAEILSIEIGTVSKITRIPSFPRLTEVIARYPRDAVFKWIEEHTATIDVLL